MYTIRSWLVIGKVRETYDRSLLAAYQIGAMLQLAEAVPYPDIVSLYLPVEDGEPLPIERLQQGVGFVREQQASGRNVLIACGAGISRSAAFALASLKEIEERTLLDAFGQIKRAHADALPHPALWRALCSYYQEEVPYLKVMCHTPDPNAPGS